MSTFASRRRSTHLIAFLATVLLSLTASGLTQPVHATTAGSPDTAFNAQFNPLGILDNRVFATAVASDGSVFVGGQFTGGLKKLNADGSLNAAFNTNVANSLFGCIVNSIALTASGSPIVGCGYNSNNVYLNKFNTNGTIDSTFAANVSTTFNNAVEAVIVSNSGTIYVGGSFTGHLKKFSSVGVPDTTFTTSVGSSLDGQVLDLMETPGGSILAAGDFTGKIKMFNADGTTTGVATTSFNSYVTGAIPHQGRALARTADGSILVGTSGGANFYKLNSDGTSTGTAAAFNTIIGSSLNSFVSAIQVLSDGSIVIGGRFTNRLKKINSDGSTTGTAATFNTAVSGWGRSDVDTLSLGNGDRIYVGGLFPERLFSVNADGSTTGATGAFNTIVAHQPVGDFDVLAPAGDSGFFAGGYVPGRIMKFANNGSPDSTFNTNVFSAINNDVKAIAVASDCSVLAGGEFTGGLKMLNADGTTTGVAATFNTNVVGVLNDRVRTILQLANGSLVVGGRFTPDRMKMFNADGTSTTGAAQTFNNNLVGVLSSEVNTIVQLADGSLVVGGESSTGRLKMFNADGTSTTGAAQIFNNNLVGVLSSEVNAIVQLADGSLVVGGDFSGKVKMFNANGTTTGVATSLFNSNVTGVFTSDVNTISLASDGSMIVGGEFTNYVKKLNSDGTSTTGAAQTFNAGISAEATPPVNANVESSLLLSDGGVIVVGPSNVTNSSGIPRQIVAKFFGAGSPVATAPSGGSCRSAPSPSGGSGSESAPDSTSTKPVVRAPAVLGPVPLGTSTLPIGGVTPGSSVLLVNGVPQSVTVRPDAPVTSQAKGLIATGEGFTMNLTGVDDRGQSLGLTNDAALVLRRDNSALVEGAGFVPNADVQVYIFSQPRLLGTIRTNSNGSFSGLVRVPGDLEIGPHTMQINSLNADDSLRSLSVGVVLQAPKVTAKQKTARASVTFDAGSSLLSLQAKRALTTLARRVGATATGGMVVGYVQRDGNYTIDEQLSEQRAKAVAKFLRRQGIKSKLVTRGNGVLNGSETARKAVVTVSYTV